jgi:hypothetical protein
VIGERGDKMATAARRGPVFCPYRGTESGRDPLVAGLINEQGHTRGDYGLVDWIVDNNSRAVDMEL